jgi:hypothetical protein
LRDGSLLTCREPAREKSLGQDELALTGSAKTIQLAVVLDPNFIPASTQLAKRNNLGKPNPRVAWQTPTKLFFVRQRF